MVSDVIGMWSLVLLVGVVGVSSADPSAGKTSVSPRFPGFVSAASSSASGRLVADFGSGAGV